MEEMNMGSLNGLPHLSCYFGYLPLYVIKR
jgi:hypothetical protein